MSKSYRRLDISGELLLSMFAAGPKRAHEIVEGLPADAKIVNVQHGWPNQISILLESKQFDEVPEGDIIPPIYITSKVGPPSTFPALAMEEETHEQPN